jgi:Tol biopolymer transport system component
LPRPFAEQLEVAMTLRLTSFLFLLLVTRVSVAQQAGDAATLSRKIQFWNPAWSPDGRTLLFESSLPGKEAIYVINRDGTGLRRITTDSSANYQPNWSPDGEHIVFSSDRAGHGELYVVHRDGSGLTRLTNMSGGTYYQSSFSPNGTQIVFQGRPDNRLTADRVYVINVDGSGLRQLTDSSFGAEGPRWEPDGKSIRFLQVPYPRRLWPEMTEGDLDRAKAGQRMMSVRPDGSGLAPLSASRAADASVAWSSDASRGFFVETRDGTEAVFERRRGTASTRRIVSTSVVPSGFETSPDGTQLAYTKEVNGSAGLYVYDVSAGVERLLTGGQSAGPIGYLRTAQLTASVDTFDTYTTAKTGGGERAPGGAYVRNLRRVGARRWEISDNWLDSSGRTNTVQSVRTGEGTLATEIETVRADRDSAALLISPRRVTAWVVPEGEPAKLFDGTPAGDRYSATIVISAIARSKPAIGATFLAPIGALFGPNPLVPNVDTLRVIARETMLRSGAPITATVIERNSGTRFWVDQATGTQVAARGSAGPQRYWWHLRRGFNPPSGH